MRGKACTFPAFAKAEKSKPPNTFMLIDKTSNVIVKTKPLFFHQNLWLSRSSYLA